VEKDRRLKEKNRASAVTGCLCCAKQTQTDILAHVNRIAWPSSVIDQWNVLQLDWKTTDNDP